MRTKPHNVSLRQLRAFQAVARRHSFVEAARHLYITPSALSELIRQLESHVGARLFDRTTRRVDLTPVGQQFFEDVVKVLDGLDLSLQRIEDGLVGDGWVRIVGAPTALKSIVIPSLVRLREQYPKVRASLIEAGADEIQASVENGEVDFGVGSVNALYQDKLFTKNLFHDRFCLIAAQDHPLVQDLQTELKLADLSDCDFISLTDNTLIHQMVTAFEALPKIVRKPVMRVSNPTLLQAALVNRLGVSIMPAFACYGFQNEALRYRLLDAPELSRTIQLLCRPGRSLSPPARIIWEEIYKNRSFIDHVLGLTVFDEDG